MDVQEDELQRIRKELRREITAIRNVDFDFDFDFDFNLDLDLDFAFQLQMEEAMNASLHIEPSSSTLQSLSLPLPNDVVSDPTPAHLVDEQITRFEQERSDRQLVEAEMRRMRDDLSRLVHDQAFAREVLRVPEEQWKQTGDYFHRPYGEDSSAAATPNAESCFSLYFKGLVCEEMVGAGAKKTLMAGIGIAICDMSDSPIFELKKPLVGGEMSGEVAEVKALIEGLNAAVTLGLNSLTVLCDNNSLYQYVTGKWLPRQSKITPLVDQVTLLQRKFTHCNPSLVAQKDIKFAFKLAREAIVSQITWPVESGCGKNLIETCVICLEDTDVGQIFTVNGCLHRYCFSCMKQYVEVKLLQGKLPKCPHEGCVSEMKIESCKKFLTPELFDIMSQRIKETSIPAALKIYCPYPKCSALMSKAEIQAHGINSSAGSTGARKCTKCYALFCVNCKVPWHSNMTCYDYKMSNPYTCAEEAKLKSLAMRNLWRQCVRCNHMVELAEGCYHIYCRCGYEFCYTCGAEWKNKKATCACPIWDERNIIYGEYNVPQRVRG